MAAGVAYIFSQEQDQFIVDHHLSNPLKRLGNLMSIGEGVIQRRMTKLGLVVPPEIIERFKEDSRIKKGNIPKNKGLAQEDYMSKEAIERTAKTRFKPGELPPTTLYDNAITTRVDKRGRAYKWIRLSKAKWEMLHVYNWKNAGKEIPPGCILRFISENTLDASVENLKLITRAEHLRLNRPAKEVRETSPTKIKKSAGNKIDKKAIRRLRTKINQQQHRELMKLERQLQKQKQQQDAAVEKQKQREEAALEKQRQREEAALEKQKQREELSHQEQLLRDQDKAKKLLQKQSKKDVEKIAAKKISDQKARERDLLYHREEMRKKSALPQFNTKQTDYSQLTAVRIDSRTTIYAKPGEDVEQVRQLYLSRCKKLTA